MGERLTEEERAEVREAANEYLEVERRSTLDWSERSTLVEHQCARDRYLNSTEPSRVLRLLDERDDLAGQLDIVTDLFGEVADLVRAAGYPESMSTFDAVHRLIAERNDLRTHVEALRSDLALEIGLRRQSENERDDLRAQLSAKEAR